MLARLSRILTTAAVVAVSAGPAAAQSAADSVAAKAARAAPVVAPASTMAVTGLLFGSYNVARSTRPGPLPGQTDNAFILDRAYLNFRASAGDRLSVRVTTDVYQTTETTPTAYAIRAKYAFLQYDTPRRSDGAAVQARAGILQNVVIEHIESFWPRYLSQTAIERAGFFASADVGISGQLTLPRKFGEVYATIVNGPSFTARERDRFKDFGIRMSLTPLASQTASPLWQTLTVTGWGYKGATSSRFVDGGAGQAGSVGEALDRSRAGLFVGVRDPRLVLGAEAAQRHDGGESGANTSLSPRLATDVTGRVLSAFTVARPLAFTNATGRSAVGVVVRYDRVTPTVASRNVLPAPDVSNGYHNFIGGVFWDVSPRAQVALDYQESLAADNGISAPPPVQAKAYFAHLAVNF